MNRRTVIILLTAILVTAGGIYLTLQAPQTDRTLIGDGITATRVTFNGEPTPAASVSVPFTRKNNTFTIANIAIDLNMDGQVKAYETESGTQEEWIVKNMRAKVVEEGNTYGFELIDPSATDMTDMPLVAVLTKVALEDWDGTVPPGEGAAAQVVISRFETEDFGGLFTPVEVEGEFLGGQAGFLSPGASDGPGTPQSAEPDLTVTSVEDPTPYLEDLTAGSALDDAAAAAQAAVEAAAEAMGAVAAQYALPEAGSDFEIFQPGVPDLNQGTNECVPTSISNGLHWLAEAYDFEDRMPDDQTATREELKDDLNWTRERGAGMGQSFMNAKVAFTARHNLPIHTHRIGGKFDDDIVRKIAVELRNGQAVEVGIGYYNWNEEAGEWRRNGGHMMSGAGAFGSNGRTYLGVHDPLSQEAGRLDMYHVDGSRIYDYRYRGNSAVFIEFAYAQSPNAAWVADHPLSVQLDTNGMAESANLQGTWFVDMLKIGNAWFPVKQFHTFKGDTQEECDAEEHWHSNGNPVWGLDMTGHNYFDTNPESVLARNAPVVSWSDTFTCGAGKTAEVERHNVMVSRAEAFALLGNIIE